MPNRAIGILLLSYLNVIRGMPWLLAIGVVTIALGFLGDAKFRDAFLIAGALFASVFPAFFAGLHFRKLASRRTHVMLPGFGQKMVAAVVGLLAIASLSGGAVAGPVVGVGAAAGCILATAFYSIVFWAGFLAFPARFLLACLLMLLVSRPGPEVLAHPLFPGVMLGVVVAGWMVFYRWFLGFVRQRGSFARQPALPGISRLAAPASIGSPEGTLLFGSSDAFWPRTRQAIFSVFGLPSLFLAGFGLFADISMERLLGTPVVIFLSLTYAFVAFLQLASRTARRRRLLWLRTDTDVRGLAALCERLLGRELMRLSVALVALLVVVGFIYPPGTGVMLAFGALWLSALLPHIYLALNTAVPYVARFWLASLHLLIMTVIVVTIREGAPVGVMWSAVACQIAVALALRE